MVNGISRRRGEIAAYHPHAVSVAEMNDGNGYAGPDSEEQIGEVEIPTSGTLVIGNHTYEQGFDQVEFKAN
jgi:hypothetical protein